MCKKTYYETCPHSHYDTFHNILLGVMIIIVTPWLRTTWVVSGVHILGQLDYNYAISMASMAWYTVCNKKFRIVIIIHSSEVHKI